MKSFSPILFTDLKGYSKNQAIKDIVAGIIVAIIALPLSIALAIASGVSPEMGIYTAAVAGLVAAFFGGSSVQISGPTAAFATIVAGIVAKNGIQGMALATVIAGIILVVMGLFKFGNLIKFIPYTITTGFTAGIAVTLVVGQLKDFFGITYSGHEIPIETIEKLNAFTANWGSINLEAVALGAVCLIILAVWPKFCEKVPASLIAVGVSIVLVITLKLNVNTIGDLYSIRSGLPAVSLPKFSLSSVIELFPDALTIALLAGIESLLSCVVADQMVEKKHRSNTELVAQGFGNIASALFGGIPATGAIARTAANVKNGGRTPISGIVHAALLFIVLMVLMPYASYIPMPAIAAILISVAYNMCQWRQFVYLVKTSPKSDILVLLVSFVLTVVFDLVVAIEVGIMIACILFMKRLSEESGVTGWQYLKDEDENNTSDLRKIPKSVRVYEISGPMFFAVSASLGEISAKQYTKCIILRMRSVPSIDSDGIKALREMVERFKKEDIRIIFSHINPQPMKAMIKSGLYDFIGEENICKNINEALEKAESIPQNA